jgi:hypothetical protein
LLALRHGGPCFPRTSVLSLASAGDYKPEEQTEDGREILSHC